MKDKSEIDEIKVWECKSCGIIIRNRNIPKECSCGNDNWFNNHQVDVIYKKGRAEMLKEVMEKIEHKLYPDETARYYGITLDYDDFKELKASLEELK